jgi:hypothetical protein
MALMVPSSVLGQADASADPATSTTSTPFVSDFGYALVLPEGWRVTLSAGDPIFGGEDLFEGPAGWTARIGGGQVEPDHSVTDRVAANRADLTADGTCQSDPAADTPTTLGGEPAIAWSWRCPDAYHASINTIHGALRLRVDVNGPADAEAEAAALLEAFRGGFAYDEAVTPAPVDAPALTPMEQALEGSYENAWHPVELEFAAIEAAGLDPAAVPDYYDSMTSVSTVRTVVKFEDGVMTEYCAADGGPLERCWEATYRLLDGDTIEAVNLFEGRSYRFEYAFTLEGGTLTLDVISGDPPEDGPQIGIVETLPFTRVP